MKNCPFLKKPLPVSFNRLIQQIRGFIWLIGCAAALLAPARAGGQGIGFTSGSWAEVLAQAKAHNQLVFVDVFTTWCGPCKAMDRSVFPDSAVGRRFNAQFINFKIDAEKGEGPALAQRYGVDAYPTMLFVDPATGELVYKVRGARPPDRLLAEADLALAERARPQALPALAQAHARGRRDTAFLRQYLHKRQHLGLDNHQLLDQYLAQLPPAQRAGLAQLQLILANARLADGLAFSVLLAHRAQARQLLGGNLDGWLQQRVAQSFRLAGQQGNEALLARTWALADTLWPGQATAQAKAWHQIGFYAAHQNGAGLARAATDYAATYLGPEAQRQARALDSAAYQQWLRPYATGQRDSTLHPAEFAQAKQQAQGRHARDLAHYLNQLAGLLHDHVADPAALQQAWAWAYQATALHLAPHHLSTQAHLLLKLGQKSEAAALAQRAAELAQATLGPDEAQEYANEWLKMKE